MAPPYPQATRVAVYPALLIELWQRDAELIWSDFEMNI